jgi:hypothetical protein
MPRCRAHRCADLARPNVLLFDDLLWNSARTAKQLELFRAWKEACPAHAKKVVVLEIGVGVAVPTVSSQCGKTICDLYGAGCDTTFIRINPGEGRGIAVPGKGFTLRASALEALTALAGALQ